MNETLEPGGIARRLLLRRALGTGIVVVIGGRMAAAADAGRHRQLHLRANARDGEGRHDRDMGESRRHSPQHRLPGAEGALARVDTDDSFAYKFDQAGTYEYLCESIHTCTGRWW
jgi:hypothetical protein